MLLYYKHCRHFFSNATLVTDGPCLKSVPNYLDHAQKCRNFIAKLIFPLEGAFFFGDKIPSSSEVAIPEYIDDH